MAQEGTTGLGKYDSTKESIASRMNEKNSNSNKGGTSAPDEEFNKSDEVKGSIQFHGVFNMSIRIRDTKVVNRLQKIQKYIELLKDIDNQFEIVLFDESGQRGTI